MSLFAEKYMVTLAGTNSFNLVFTIFFNFGISLIILKFIKKGFETYILWTDGDADSDPLTLVVNFAKAIVVAIGFPVIYGWFAKVVEQMSTQVVNAIGLTLEQDLAALLTGISTAGLFTAIVSLIFFITFFVLYIQFLMKGLELLVLRIGMPLACTGLLDSDKGIFKPYCNKLVQMLTAIVVQLALAKLGIALMMNLHAFWGLAAMLLAVRTPRVLQEFIVVTGGSGRGMSTVYQTVQLSRAAKAIFSK